MGAPAQQPVYYDTETSQYYTVGNNRTYNPNNPGPAPAPQNSLADAMSMLFGKNDQRNYLGNPYGSNSSADRFTPKFVPTQYPEMNLLFPALNSGLLQGISYSQTPTGAMYGAGRFLAPQTTSESKGK